MDITFHSISRYLFKRKIISTLFSNKDFISASSSCDRERPQCWSKGIFWRENSKHLDRLAFHANLKNETFWSIFNHCDLRLYFIWGQCKDKEYLINIVKNFSKQITMLNFLYLTILSLGSLALAQECFIQGRCINSHLIQLTDAGSATDCLQDCKDFQGCQWYSFNQRSQTTCELFSDCNEITTNDCDHCQTGQVSCDLSFCKISFKRILNLW